MISLRSRAALMFAELPQVAHEVSSGLDALLIVPVIADLQ
jgi:hypothetical protein